MEDNPNSKGIAVTQDEMIELARQAGLDPDLWNYTDAFEIFAKLVAEKEREACAETCEGVWLDTVEAQTHNDKCVKAIRARGQA